MDCKYNSNNSQCPESGEGLYCEDNKKACRLCGHLKAIETRKEKSQLEKNLKYKI